ncbi:MAG: D-lactate dehydrogenase VanH-A [Clostridiales Family XIII bacterium]|jgi:D-specific alpha-keto acid dehydrogenase|nr:D-lactate dehydrogenase VanH-A [Clostridiales Family XIII bacterium]
MKEVGITVFECEKDEADAFHAISPRFGVKLTITGDSVPACGATPASGNQCVSVSHKSGISESNLLALRESGVKYISTRSIGCDHIDMEAAGRMGIAVGNVAYPPDGVADYTLMLMLMAIRNAKPVVTGAAKYDFRPDAIRGKELRDMTVGVVGAGRIGGAVIRRLHGFGCRVVAHDRNREAGGLVSLNELLEKSDVVTLHTPLNADTHHIIGRRQLDVMKQGAFLINTGRGALVDTDGLIEALEAGKLGGAALDVLEGEEGIFYFDCSQKPIDNRFLQRLQEMPNVIITPHTAYHTRRTLYDTVEKTILNCLDFERGQDHA